MKEYRVVNLERLRLNRKDDDIWAIVPEVLIENYPWDKTDYRPKTEVKVYYTDVDINIQFKAFESKIRSIYEEPGDPVYKDSCAEFFFNPDPEHNERYINIEVNALGTPLVQIGIGREGRVNLTDEFLKHTKIYSSVTKENIGDYIGPFWTIEYSIPYSFIKEYYGKVDFKSRKRILGNFYKCGDDTKYPHYGCWNLIDCKKEDFHRPEYFANIILR